MTDAAFLERLVELEAAAPPRDLVVGDLRVRVRGVTAATDLGDGRPTLVLDLYALRAGDAPRPEAA